MSENKEQILRTGLTPVWGLAAGTADKATAVALLVTSANVSTETSSADQLDSEGRKCGYVCYDCWQTINITANVIYDAETDNLQAVSNMFKAGAAISDTAAVALLNSVRTTKMNGCEAEGTGTYICKSFDVNQSNTSAVEISLSVEYVGFSS